MKQLSIITLLTFFLSFNSWSQQGRLKVYVEAYTWDDPSCYQLAVLQNNDTVYAQILNTWEDYENSILIDSLSVGQYFVSLNQCEAPSEELLQSATLMVEIRENEIASISIGMNQYTEYTSIDKETHQEIVDFRNEFQTEYSYFDFRWNPDGNNPKFNFGLAGSGYSWFSFSKHFGFLLGGGFGWNFAQLQIDEETVANYPDKVKANYYNYFYGKIDMKFRLSMLNQQSDELQNGNVFLDIGAAYHLPLYFKRVTRFDIHDKLVNSYIHRWTDVQLYANFGITHFQVFAAYRPFDFIGKGLPQFPKYNVGVKFNFHER